MKLSLIVPVYNTQAYLEKCMESLLNQTWTDLEILCVNDGSTDDSGEILDKFARRDSRVQVISQENRGLSAARNAGLRRATGEYVCFVDSDDVLELDACRRLALEILGKEPDLVVFGAKTLPPEELQKDPWLKWTLSPRDEMLREGDLRRLMQAPGAWPFVWRDCVRRELLLRENLWFDESVRYGEDTVFQLCLLPACRRVSFISDRLYIYRKDRPGSLMERLKAGREKRAEMHLPLVEKTAAYWRKKGWMDSWGDVFLGWSLEFAAYDVYRAEKERRGEYARRLMRLWADAGLEGQPMTACARSYYLLVESCTGKHRVKAWCANSWRRAFGLGAKAAVRLLNR